MGVGPTRGAVCYSASLLEIYERVFVSRNYSHSESPQYVSFVARSNADPFSQSSLCGRSAGPGRALPAAAVRRGCLWLPIVAPLYIVRMYEALQMLQIMISELAIGSS